MPLPLIALFIAAFAFGTTEFVVAGVLPQLAEGLGISVPTAGYLVSGYAIGIAIGGPLLTLATARLPRKTLLIALLLAFTVGQAACALAPDFGSMMSIRVTVAIAHGTYFGVAMVVAVGMVRSDQRGMAVALILAGLTVSNIIGVPAGTAIGHLWGWRATFWTMFGLGVLAILAMAILLPRAAGRPAKTGSLKSEVKVLGRQQVWTSLILMLMLMLCQFVPYTYIVPLLSQVTGLDAAMIPFVLLLNGIGATAGVFIGGKFADRQLMPALITMLVLQAVVMVTLYFVSPYQWPMIAAITVWGGLNFAVGTPIQTRILAWTADAPNLASSLIPSGFNFGIAIAASLGALMLSTGYSFRSLPLVGVVAMVVAAAVAAMSYGAELRSSATQPQPAAG
ncbi:MFS transporter [Mesorhizobium sp. NBSH29]|uniref:MFS transporter n=1 Tax=Mesorhizobium sp. NBSH29 TaxID=2654249 RepID=UPI0018964141|nr:MFS transporter [Mesorhizobium sp. NBSH29]QPC88362.1 MFS transporter [Mesorhizobium sp. NBSH29]